MIDKFKFSKLAMILLICTFIVHNSLSDSVREAEVENEDQELVNISIRYFMSN